MVHNADLKVKEGTLYVVGTPIGNLRDITLRAIDILREVDIVATEDTRVSRKLLESIGVQKRTIAHHLYNERKSSEGIVNLLQKGKSVAFVSDAGTPCISDPGALLVSKVRVAGLKVISIPGPSALTAAVAISGFSAGTLHFHGFLPPKGPNRMATIEEAAKMKGIQIFFEAPHRLKATVQDLLSTFGDDCKITVCKELTKLFEKSIESTLGKFFEAVNSGEFDTRGEFVLILEGPLNNYSSEENELERVLDVLLEDLGVKDAVRLATRLTGENRNLVYKIALERKIINHDFG